MGILHPIFKGRQKLRRIHFTCTFKIVPNQYHIMTDKMNQINFGERSTQNAIAIAPAWQARSQKLTAGELAF